MKKRRIYIILIGVFFAVLVVGALICRSFGHFALQSYIAELRAKGEKVTFREACATLSTNLNDSAAIITNAAQKLGAPPADPETLGAMQFSQPGCARVAWQENAPPWASAKGSGGNATWADLSNRVTHLAAPLAELRLALKVPSPNGGPRPHIVATLPIPFAPVKSATMWLASVALLDLHDGRKADALANIQALAGMANLHREEYLLASQMIRVAVAGQGLALTWEALQSSDWDNEQLRILQKSWEGVDLLDGAERGLIGERCLGLDLLEILRENKGRPPGKLVQSSTNSSTSRSGCDPLFWWVYMGTVLENDSLWLLRHNQAQVEQVRLLRSNRPWKQVLDGMLQQEAQVERKAVSPTRFFYLISLITAVPTHKAVQAAVRAETTRRLTITAIALRRYELKHHQPAATLEALVPDFLGSVPLDCMSGRPLCCRIGADGKGTLYSVGEDGKDDGGNPAPTVPGGKPGLWEGRDAVWPLPLRQEKQR